MGDDPTTAPATGQRHRSWSELAVPAVVFGVVLLVYHQRYLTFLASDQPLVGTDYSYFLPHLLAGDYWFAVNGPFAVPWMTPAFCGGLPFYGNPQSFYYSPAQWLSFLVDPLTAVRWSIVLFAAAGATGMYLLLRRTFVASMQASLLAGVIFLFNGFFSHRMLIGHFAFIGFMLAPGIAALLIGGRTAGTWLPRGLAAGLLIALAFQSGLVVLFLPCAMAVLFLMLLAAIRAGGGVGMVKATGVALIAAGALCVSKLVAAAAFVSQFGRDFYPLPGVDEISDLLSVVLQMLFGRPDASFDKIFQHGRVRMAIHEWEYSLSPVPLIVIALGVGFAAYRLFQRRGRSPGPFDMRVAILALLLLVPLTLNFYTPSWNTFLQHLPIIGSMQTLSRWFSFYLLVLPVLAGLCLDQLPDSSRAPVAFVGICAVLAFHLTEDLTKQAHLPRRAYDPTDIQEAWRELHRTGEVRPITFLAVLRKSSGRIDGINGENALARGASSLVCYEPLFGYDLKKFPRQSLHEGATMDVTDGDLNVKNPACFMYPMENDCRPGAHLPEARQAEAEAFLSYKPFEWKRPARQKGADALNLGALVLVPGLLFWSALAIRRRRATG